MQTGIAATCGLRGWYRKRGRWLACLNCESSRRPSLVQAVEEGTILGPRLLFTGHALSQTGGHGDMRGK